MVWTFSIDYKIVSEEAYGLNPHFNKKEVRDYLNSFVGRCRLAAVVTATKFTSELTDQLLLKLKQISYFALKSGSCKLTYFPIHCLLANLLL